MRSMVIGFGLALAWTSACGGRNTSPAPSSNAPATNSQAAAGATSAPKDPSPSPPAAAPAAAAPTAAAAVTYSTTIKPYFNSACLPCHATGGHSPALDSLSAAQAGASASLQAMQSGSMPTSGKAAQAAIDNLNTWIKAGTPN